MRIYYLADGHFHHAELEGIGFTLFVPEVIYCKADLGWGDVKEVYTHAMLLGNGSAKGDLSAYQKRGSWVWDVAVLLQMAEARYRRERTPCGI